MPDGSERKSAIGVTAFKSKCLGLIDDVAMGKREHVLLLKHNRPVAAIVPVAEDTRAPFELWGALRGTITVAPDADRLEDAGETLDAEK